MFDPSTLPPRRAGQLFLIIDRVAAPADFIILGILASHLRQAPNKKCILVSFSEAYSHWSSVAARLSPPTNLSLGTSKGSFVFVDALSEEQPSLRTLYDKIYELLGSDADIDDHPNMLILDGLSMIDWSGTPISEIRRFVRALRALCSKHNAMMVIRHHTVASGHLDDLSRALLSQCALHLEVLPLASGRSGAISGEIAVHVGPLFDDSKTITTVHRSAAVQYRLRDSGPVYFGRGTSAGVL